MTKGWPASLAPAGCGCAWLVAMITALTPLPAMAQGNALEEATRIAETLDRLRREKRAAPQEVETLKARGVAMIDGADKQADEELSRVPRDRESEPERQRLRMRRCRLALLRADLFLRAAGARAANDPGRAEEIETAIREYRTLRVEFGELVVAGLGYIGEARAHRLAGKPDAAIAALRPLLDAKSSASDSPQAELRRVAQAERLESLLMQDAQAAA
jgi:hypothetical protein